MKKKRDSKKVAVSNSAVPEGSVVAHRPRRSWMPILLGVAAIGLVLFLTSYNPLQSGKERTEGKVHSSAADQFKPMAKSSRQTGFVEPPGVAKPLHLFAVKVGSTASQGLAVLGPAESSSRTYSAGALLENGARLTELYSDHVVLVRADESYTLYLPDKGKSDALESHFTRELMVGGVAPAASPAVPSAVRMSDAIRVAPAYEGDQMVGFHVYPGAKAGQMEKWGLVSGDLLVSLYGQPLNDIQQVESAMEQLAQGESIPGEVLRGQERLAVTLDGALLLASTPSEPPPPMP